MSALRAARRIRLLPALVAVALAAWSGAAWAQSAPAAKPPADPWPREVDLGTAKALVYQPQVNSWQGNALALRAAVAVRPNGTAPEMFGVMWATARTQVDRGSRIVALEDFTVTKTDFPTLPDRGAAYGRALQQRFAASQRTIALDRLEASLAMSGTVKPAEIAVNNAPPWIIVSESPALLVPIDGDPVIRPIAGTTFERVINTRALMMRPQGDPTFYLHVYDGWMTSGGVGGPWVQASMVPPAMNTIAAQLKSTGQVDLLDGGNTTPKPSLASGVPAIYVSIIPAEIIVFRGAPTYTAIPGTSLQWASNTRADVIFDNADRSFYALLAGRWYRSASLQGPWTFVASPSLPADFRRIPVTSPAGVVLAAVAGSPQAHEAVIANSIPQTATIPRVNGPKFTAVYDGPPQLRPIEGSTLQYVVNSPTPIIQVTPTELYALRAGVWFTSASLSGPWVVAASVPAAIYAIPPTSPLHYVTYVYVYGSTAKVVYVGYTPGYLGTVVAPGGVVVYGTGYAYQPWIGTAWYPPPATYGVVAQPVYNPAVGMAFGFAMGVTTAAVTGAFYHPYYYPGYYGYPCCGSTSANVYGTYGNTTWSGTRTYYSNSSSVGMNASGNYTNYRTGTTGSYTANRSVDPSAGTATQGYTRTFNTPGGTSGGVDRSETYNASTGRYSYASGASATGPGGTEVTTQRQTGPSSSGGTSTDRQTTVTNPNTDTSRTTTASAGVGPQGASAQRQTTYSNANTGASATVDRGAGTGAQGTGRGGQVTYTNPSTGQAKTYGAAREGNNVYADDNGQVYKNSSGGWQQHTSSGGWQSADSTPSWADKEQQARSQGEDRFSNFSQSGGWASRFDGGGGWGDRFGGGGWGDRSGGDGWGDRFGGGGRFGGFAGRGGFRR